MTLIKCDVCGNIVKPRESWNIQLKGGPEADVIFSGRKGYGRIDEANKDICRACAINLLRTLYQNVDFPDEKDYEKIESGDT